MQDFLPLGFPAELNVLCSTGPMARSLRDCQLFMSVLKNSDQHMTDPLIVPILWNPAPPLSKPIRLGIMTTDGVITPQPPVLKAIQWAQQKLKENANFILKPFTTYKAAEAIANIGLAYWPDNGLATKSNLAQTGEPMHPLTISCLGPVSGPSAEKTATEVMDMRLTRDSFRAKFLADYNSQGIDFVLCPCYVGSASKHDEAHFWNFTALWNYVDYPAVVFPTPIKASGKEEYEPSYVPLSERCKKTKEQWDQGGYEGAPINLQLVGRRWQDNEVLGVLGELQRWLGFA